MRLSVDHLGDIVTCAGGEIGLQTRLATVGGIDDRITVDVRETVVLPEGGQPWIGFAEYSVSIDLTGLNVFAYKEKIKEAVIEARRNFWTALMEQSARLHEELAG